MTRKREWYVAVGDMSGDHEGNPLAFEASDVYGPFTAAQALRLYELGEDFPHASYGVTIFRRSPGTYRDVARLIKAKKAEAMEEAAREHEEHEEAKRRARA